MARDEYTIETESASPARTGSIPRDLWATKRTLLVIVLPLVLLPLPILSDATETKCAYGLAVMAVFWITESLPLAVTALLPMVVFPLFGVMKATDVARNYIQETTMFGFGGLTIAIAVENCRLHKRIALKTLTLVGAQPRWLMLGFMVPTWFLSMWISNTATTAMMIPIVSAVIDELRQINQRSRDGQVGNGIEMEQGMTNGGYLGDQVGTSFNDEAGAETIPEETCCRKANTTQMNVPKNPPMPFDPTDRSHDSPEFTRLCKGFCLCVAYAANVGGTGSLSGSGPNLVMQGQAEILFGKYGLDSGVNFLTWMIFALPGSVICVTLAWMWLQTLFLGKTSLLCCISTSRGQEKVTTVIKEEYEKNSAKCPTTRVIRAVSTPVNVMTWSRRLSPEMGFNMINFAEVGVLVHFITLVLAWLTRNIPYVGGWGQFLPTGFVGDSMAAILICVSLFVFPSIRPSVFCWRKSGNVMSRSVPPLLTWDVLQNKFPWGVLLLIGGGYALADACEKSGLSQWIGNQLAVFSFMDPSVMNLVLTLLVAAATEVTSNSATASLLLPIMGNLAITLNMNPLFLMFPCVIATSFAFMLPVATPPNAIVFANGYIKVADMAIAGLGMNVVCVLVLALATNTWGDAYFDLFTLPPGFPLNSTGAVL
ncbi:solute carrier family 13 member 5-like [Haliotis rubra]|uniref:solute carrier family 13 member 5-like n=1 Tax=Haliotis rubra TaxID=36100 RepID=UPI001EE5F662|nr:solute carrier family 13 member 5-like [Haliotis rubra]